MRQDVETRNGFEMSNAISNSNQTDLSRPVREFASPVETVMKAGQTVAEGLAALRERKIDHKVIYFYVVDDDNHLVGVISTRKLLLCDPAVRVGAVMDSPAISVLASMTLEEAMEMFAMHRLLAFPVVEADGKLIGQVDIDLYAEEAVDVSESERTAELFQLIGFSRQQARMSTPWGGFVMRMPWLMCNIAGGIVCAIIAACFRDVLDRVLVLAMFIPLVLTLSEAISMQSMTLTLQQMRIRQAGWANLWWRAKNEWRTMSIVAAFSGFLVALAATFWGQGHLVAVTIGVSIAASMATAATLGATIPILLHMMRLDPKLAAGPIVLMIADVFTTAVYMALAAWWLL